MINCCHQCASVILKQQATHVDLDLSDKIHKHLFCIVLCRRAGSHAKISFFLLSFPVTSAGAAVDSFSVR